MIIDSLLGTKPNVKTTSRRTGLRRDLGDPLSSSWHRLATAPHGAHCRLLVLTGLLGSRLPSARCFSCQVQLIVSEQWWEPPAFIAEEIVPSTDINNPIPRKQGVDAYLPYADGCLGSCQPEKCPHRVTLVGQPHE